MKRILCAFAAAVMAVCLCAPAFASDSSVSVRNNVSGSKPVSYTYDAESSGEIVKSIKTLMTKLDDLTRQNSVTQTLTVTSDSAGKVPVNIGLRVSIPEKSASAAKPEIAKTPAPDEYSALDYYNIKITAADGTVIYDYEDETNSEDSEDSEDDEDKELKTYRDISLGTFNISEGSESKTFNIDLSVNKSMDKTSIANNAKKLDWSIVSDTYDTAEEPAAETGEAWLSETAVPISPAPVRVTDAPAAAPSAQKTDKNGKVSLNQGEYLVGTDIEPGRYTMTGEGKVHVYTPEGILKTTIALKAKNDTSANGVSEYIINLGDGEKINVEASAVFEPFTQSTKPTSTPRTATKTTSSTRTTPTPKPTAMPKASSKSNPKTGDSAPLMGVSAIGVLALTGAVFIVIKRKKENN